MLADKPFKTFTEQKELLESRNLCFMHPNDFKLLCQNNYYFLTGYKDLLLSSRYPERYKDGAKFEELYNLYMFDKQLRILLLDIILEIEQHVKTLIAYEVTKNHGNKTTSYTDVNHYDATNPHVADTIDKINHQLIQNGTKNKAINHYKTNHGYIPLWVGVKILTFGVIHNLYSILKPNEKDFVARNLLTIDIPKRRAKTVDCYLHMLVDARNVCAHDEIFYNFLHGSIKIPPTSFHSSFHLLKNKNGEIIQGRKDLFALLIIIKHFVSKTRFKKFMKQLSSLIDKQAKGATSYKKEELLDFMHLPKDYINLAKI